MNEQKIKDLQLLETNRRHKFWEPFMRKYNCETICEIGVRKGNNFGQMIKHNPKTAVAVDIWKDDGNIARNDLGLPQNELDKQYEDFMEVLGKKPFVQVYREYSYEAVKRFNDNFFDFIYIDADHTYEGCLRDMIEWYPKVKPGGFFIGDNYRIKTTLTGVKEGVIEAVKEFTDKNNLKFFVLPYAGCYGWGIIKI